MSEYIHKRIDCERLGLYLHIPFCKSICHYCDFPKTRLFNKDLVSKYFSKLKTVLQQWLSVDSIHFSSVYLGGGTPGLFAEEYASIFALLRGYIDKDAEITIEVNPNDVRRENLSIWKDFGINRISIGVQSFNDDALRFLTRSHSSKTAEHSIELAKDFFSNVNIDLIYGLPSQKVKD